ncbi:hypothetical protein CRM22_006518 [Opisthorchis felineus]|uniref:Uncharacterized protein n=1 Tax=Opisthorchis felineus TaxID=147828 RepID=A0A4V6RGY0_OPIFE|nr:hypothetical protein CRM22_006518 [Opisthorchis felineus]
MNHLNGSKQRGSSVIESCLAGKRQCLPIGSSLFENGPSVPNGSPYLFPPANVFGPGFTPCLLGLPGGFGEDLTRSSEDRCKVTVNPFVSRNAFTSSKTTTDPLSFPQLFSVMSNEPMMFPNTYPLLSSAQLSLETPWISYPSVCGPHNEPVDPHSVFATSVIRPTKFTSPEKQLNNSLNINQLHSQSRFPVDRPLCTTSQNNAVNPNLVPFELSNQQTESDTSSSMLEGNEFNPTSTVSIQKCASGQVLNELKTPGPLRPNGLSPPLHSRYDGHGDVRKIDSPNLPMDLSLGFRKELEQTLDVNRGGQKRPARKQSFEIGHLCPELNHRDEGQQTAVHPETPNQPAVSSHCEKQQNGNIFWQMTLQRLMAQGSSTINGWPTGCDKAWPSTDSSDSSSRSRSPARAVLSTTVSHVNAAGPSEQHVNRQIKTVKLTASADGLRNHHFSDSQSVLPDLRYKFYSHYKVTANNGKRSRISKQNSGIFSVAQLTNTCR